jgi:hypothetical protein
VPTTARLWNSEGQCVLEEHLDEGATRWLPHGMQPGLYTFQLAGNFYRVAFVLQ